MENRPLPETPMSAAVTPTTPNLTGSWRFERPVFINGIAPCREACPLGINIAEIMVYNKEGNFKQAYDKFCLENPFPGICGQVCFYPCQRVCNRGRFDEAISIKNLDHV